MKPERALIRYLIKKLLLAQFPAHKDDNQQSAKRQQNIGRDKVHQVENSLASNGKRRVFHKAQRGESTKEERGDTSQHSGFLSVKVQLLGKESHDDFKQ